MIEILKLIIVQSNLVFCYFICSLIGTWRFGIKLK